MINASVDKNCQINGNYAGKVFLLTVLLPVCMLVAAGYCINRLTITECQANGISVLAALLCWVISGGGLSTKIFGKRFFWVLTALIVVRIAANFIYFYYVFGPLAGISSSADLASADYTGDLQSIFHSAMYFVEACSRHNVFFALFGDYYRGINNPGIPVVYGGLFYVFGAYGTVAIAWTVVYSAFAAVLIGAIGFFQKLPAHLCRVAAFLVFLMPGFFVFPPLYRDNFIVFALVLSAFTAFMMLNGNSLVVGAAVVLESLILFGLRKVYGILPLSFNMIAMCLDGQFRKKFFKHSFVLVLFLMIGVIIGWDHLVVVFYDCLERFGIGFASEMSDFSILKPFKAMGPFVFYPAAAVFSLLAPMPWWQDVAPTLLAYQIFFYFQTWYSLTVLVALFESIRTGLITKQAFTLIVFALLLFLLALFGSFNFAAGYVQVALPFVILASIHYLTINWKKCFGISTVMILLIHVFLWLK